MKIVAIKTGRLDAPLKVPFKTAVRTVESMTDVIVRIETDCETVGWGSAPPTAKVTGDTVGSITGAVDEAIRPLLLGRDAEALEENLAVLDGSIVGNTSAKAAVDIALHDLWARAIGHPAWKLFGGTGRSIETDVTVSVNSPEEMACDALRGKNDGFKVIKTKVGLDAETDFKRLRAIRDAVGPEIKIRIDANQGWKPGEAVRILEKMQEAGFDLELVEQPVRAGDIKGLAYVTAHSPIPVVADESCWSPADALRIISEGAANMVNIKLMKCGGVGHARQIIALSEAMGTEVMMGCMLEGKVSCAAAVHLASAYKCVTRIDIDGPVLCAADPVKGGPCFTGGAKITIDDAAGFGISGISGVKWLS